MSEKDIGTVKFSYDLFKLAQEKSIHVVGLNDNEDGTYSVEVSDSDPEVISKVQDVLKELIDSVDLLEPHFSMDGTWLIDFNVDEEFFKNYEGKEWANVTDEIKTKIEKELQKADEIPDEEDEEDDRKGVEIVKKEGNVTVYADGVVEIDVDPWEFAVVPREKTIPIPFMKFQCIIQEYDWATLVGLFLGDDDFKDNEAYHSRGQSARWIIKGISPIKEEYFYEIHDAEAGDTPQIHSNTSFGIYEMMEWFKEKFKDKTPIEYTKDVILPSGKKAQFGIDKDGNSWYTWSRCGWLSELGLE